VDACIEGGNQAMRRLQRLRDLGSVGAVMEEWIAEAARDDEELVSRLSL
jgi:hypothetical protein